MVIPITMKCDISQIVGILSQFFAKSRRIALLGRNVGSDTRKEQKTGVYIKMLVSNILNVSMMPIELMTGFLNINKGDQCNSFKALSTAETLSIALTVGVKD